jgi:hypothetical protein
LIPIIDNGGKPQINGKNLWKTADHPEKPVCTFLTCLSCGEQTGGKNWQDYRSRKIFSSKEYAVYN